MSTEASPPPPELTGTVMGAMMLASAREHGIPYEVAVMMALQVAYVTCLVAALTGGGS
jgi:hypothetical protein